MKNLPCGGQRDLVSVQVAVQSTPPVGQTFLSALSARADRNVCPTALLLTRTQGDRWRQSLQDRDSATQPLPSPLSAKRRGEAEEEPLSKRRGGGRPDVSPSAPLLRFGKGVGKRGCVWQFSKGGAAARARPRHTPGSSLLPGGHRLNPCAPEEPERRFAIFGVPRLCQPWRRLRHG